MPFRAALAVVWLLFACVGAAPGAVLRDHLYGVKALSETDAWAVGNYGAIYRTTNGGRTWEARESPTKVPLFSIDFANAEVGWAVGKSAEILGTTDGGKTWKRQKSPIPPSKHLFKVSAASPTHVWAVGDWGAIAVTTDGGATWEDRSLPKLVVRGEERPDRVESIVLEDVVLYDIAWADARHGVIVGEFATVLVTTDGGATWVKRTPPTEKTLFGAHFASPDEGWVVGIDGLVLHTTDAGRTWTVQHGNPEPATIDELAFTDALANPGMYAVAVVGTTGVVVGDTGTLLLSSDGGRSWDTRVLPDRERYSWMRDVSLVDGVGVVVGAKGLSGILRAGELTLAEDGKAVAPAD
jgi:photosystem II stability/assembly factor-like uncharacterized protein